MDSTEKYVDDAIHTIEVATDLSVWEKEGKIGVLLTTVGKYSESIAHFERSYSQLREKCSSYVWDDLFLSVGTAYAIALDYLNEIESADDVFQELMKSKINGSKIHFYERYTGI